MTKLIELKDKVFRFCAEYETYLRPLYKFILALVLFLLYFRMAPKDCVLFILTPILFKFKIPYILPIGSSLLRNVYSVVAVVCGTIAFYFLDGVYQNVTSLASTIVDGGNAATDKFTITVSQLLTNKEMYLMVVISVLTAVVVYVVRRLSVEYAWKIAIVSGVLVQISGLFAGYLLCGISGKTAGMIIGNIAALLIGFVLEFLFMDLDYQRTERLQFEDDDYYYYVKAVPKKMVTSSEKTVKHFGNTTAIGKRMPSSKTKMIKEDGKRNILEELDFDENLLK